MPGLIAFNRRWGIGSDDFVFPALIELSIRLIWFIAIVVIYVQHNAHLKCTAEQLLQTYLTILIIGLVFIIFLDILIVWISSLGTITQTRPQIVWNGFGTKWAFTPKDHVCEPKEVIIIVQIIAICSWLLVGVIFLGIFLTFDPIGSRSHHVYSHRVSDIERGEPQPLYINLNNDGTEKAKRIWEWRMRLLCCCSGKKDEQSKNAYSEIAKLFANYFEDVDLVPSDIAAGLILLHQKQATDVAARTSTSQHSENYSVMSPDSVTSTGAVQGSIISSPGVFLLSPPPHQFWMTPEMACHFMKFALGSYGWPMFLYSNGLSGFCRLWSELKCCACCCKQPDYIVDDNCCNCHTAVLKYTTGLSDDDIIYISFHNRIYEIPFYVAVDHQTCSVVIAIRGTLSLFDTLTDLTAESDHLNIDGCPPNMHCHRGMLRAANFVKQKLEESHALSDAFALHQSYSLTITGHSLGAGTAALLAVLLRPIYPNLRCYAFAPPGGLMSIDGVKYTEDIIFSVILGDDIVPRLSVPNMEDMKKRLLACILDCEQPKYKIFLQRIFSFMNKPKAPEVSSQGGAVSRPLLEHFGQSSTSGNYTTNSSQEGSENSGSSSQVTTQSQPATYIPLYLPGRILHFTHSNSSFQARWISADNFNQIIVSPRMIADHMPDTIYNALKQVTNSIRSFVP